MLLRYSSSSSCVRVCVRACVSVCVCMRAYMHACTCVRACARARVRACVHLEEAFVEVESNHSAVVIYEADLQHACIPFTRTHARTHARSHNLAVVGGAADRVLCVALRASLDLAVLRVVPACINTPKGQRSFRRSTPRNGCVCGGGGGGGVCGAVMAAAAGGYAAFFSTDRIR